jgi:hypothetical protein
MAQTIEDLAGDWRRLDERIDGLSANIEALARRDASCERLMSVPGVGPIVSSAMVDQPFDILAETATASARIVAGEMAKSAKTEIWLMCQSSANRSRGQFPANREINREF